MGDNSCSDSHDSGRSSDYGFGSVADVDPIPKEAQEWVVYDIAYSTMYPMSSWSFQYSRFDCTSIMASSDLAAIPALKPVPSPSTTPPAYPSISQIVAKSIPYLSTQPHISSRRSTSVLVLLVVVYQSRLIPTR